MPFSAYDPEGELLAQYHREKISAVVQLATDEECHKVTGRGLRSLYALEGFEVIYLPIQDLGIPSQSDLEGTLVRALELSRNGNNLVIHCHAGIGRTGTFLACLAKQVYGFSGEQAISWVRDFVPQAVENEVQRQFIDSY